MFECCDAKGHVERFAPNDRALELRDIDILRDFVILVPLVPFQFPQLHGTATEITARVPDEFYVEGGSVGHGEILESQEIRSVTFAVDCRRAASFMETVCVAE